MIRFTLLALFTLLSFHSFAHQPDLSSTMLVEVEKGKWILQVRSSLTAFEQEVHHHFGYESYSSPEEFQELVVDHLRENIRVHFGEGKAALLAEGKVRLGHETSVVFELSGVPDDFCALTVQNSSFKDIHHNQGALVVLKLDFQKQQFMLNNANGHTAQLMAVGQQFEIQ